MAVATNIESPPSPACDPPPPTHIPAAPSPPLDLR